MDLPVVNSDWAPTFLEIAGATGDSSLDGQSILPLLRGEKGDSDRTFFWHFPHYNNQGGRPAGAVRAGDWKLIEYYDTAEVGLYNLKSDPGEQKNLAKAQSERARRMRASLAEWGDKINTQNNLPNPNLEEDLFRKLYVEFDPSTFDPQTASDAKWQAAYEWRALMDDVVRRK